LFSAGASHDTDVANRARRADSARATHRHDSARHGVRIAAASGMRAIWLVLVMVACGGGQSPTGMTDDAFGECRALPAMIENAVAVRGTCVDDADCAIVGGQLGPPTCGCAPAVLDCGGSALERNAPGFETARELMAHLTNCAPIIDCFGSGPLPCPCDCPPNEARCNNGRCIAQPIGSCFPEPPPDAATADAEN
jgi:hypothetical protein